jgi:hypothetical protein
MIWLVIFLVSGIILKVKVVAALPLVYLISKRNKDFGLLSYFFYIILLLSEIQLSNLFSFESFRISVLVAIPSVMCLSEILQGFEKPRGMRSYSIILLSIMGLIHEVFLVFAVFSALLMKLSVEDLKNTMKSKVTVLLFALLLISFISLWKLEILYIENQIAVVGSAVIIAILMLRDVKKVDFFEES